MPTLRRSWYLANHITVYKMTVAISSNSIEYSIPYDVRLMYDRSGSPALIMLRISHGAPSDRSTANELAPNEFDTPMPPSPKCTEIGIHSSIRIILLVKYLCESLGHLKLPLAYNRQPPRRSVPLPIPGSQR